MDTGRVTASIWSRMCAEQANGIRVWAEEVKKKRDAGSLDNASEPTVTRHVTSCLRPSSRRRRSHSGLIWSSSELYKRKQERDRARRLRLVRLR